MCCIVYGRAEKIRPYVKRMMKTNPHGAGMAWIETDNKVHYVKGIMSPDRAKMLLRQLEGADVAFHARIATVGGYGPLLTHPFVIEGGSPINLNGTAEKVLFHNGHVNGYEKLAPETADSDWTDSRAVAHSLAIGAIESNELSALPGRFLLLSSEKVEMIGNWTDHDGLKFSNMNWNVQNNWRVVTKGATTIYTPITGVTSADAMDVAKKDISRLVTDPRTPTKDILNFTKIADFMKGPMGTIWPRGKAKRHNKKYNGKLRYYPGSYLNKETEEVVKFLNESPDYWDTPLGKDYRSKF